MLILTLSFFFFSIDFLVKRILEQNLTYNHLYPVIGNILHIRLVHNTGIAFGLFKDKTIILTLAGIIFIVVFTVWIIKEYSRFNLRQKIFMSMVLGGGLGNLYDRIVYGFVIDYIDLGWWPVFNLADSFISIGCVLFLLNHLLVSRNSGLSGKD